MEAGEEKKKLKYVSIWKRQGLRGLSERLLCDFVNRKTLTEASEVDYGVSSM